MSTAREHHHIAMDYAAKGLMARMRGHTEEAASHFEQALENELAAIDKLPQQSGLGWSILHRSAATMALDCEDFRMAEKLASTALAGDPHPEVADELRDVWEQANSQRHLELKGVELAPDEIQVSLAGGDVGWGFVRFTELNGRVQNVSKLMARIMERMENRPFRQRGRMPRELADRSELFVSTARASGFAVTVRLSSPNKERTNHEDLNTSEIVDEFMDLMELVNGARIEEIQERIPDAAYLHNFLDLSSRIAPDGDRIRQVGFTVLRLGTQRSVEFTRSAADIRPARPGPRTYRDQAVPQPLVGLLLGADATGPKNDRISIVDDESVRHEVHVPSGQIEDIIGSHWESRVSITWSRRGRQMLLQDINRV